MAGKSECGKANQYLDTLTKCHFISPEGSAESTNIFHFKLCHPEEKCKNYWKSLLAGTIPAYNSSLAGTVPANNSLLARTVPANNSLLAGTAPANTSP